MSIFMKSQSDLGRNPIPEGIIQTQLNELIATKESFEIDFNILIHDKFDEGIKMNNYMKDYIVEVVCDDLAYENKISFDISKKSK